MTPAETRCVMTQIVMPMHTNGVAGVMFGGIMMQWIDVCAGVAAMRQACGAVLTASIDRLDFLSPVRVGEIVILQAMVNYVARTSMEVGCRVETEDMRTQTRAELIDSGPPRSKDQNLLTARVPLVGTRRYVTKAYLTFVAVDEGGRPRQLPPLALDTDDDVRRHAQADARRHLRLRAAGRPEKPS